MSILDNAKKHFESSRQLKEIKVAEWDGSVYYYDPPNMAERNKVLEMYDAEKDRFSPDAITMMFMVRARNEEGQLLFSRAAFDESFRQVSQNFDPSVIQRITRDMGGLLSIFGGVSHEEAEKN